jgi:5,10-methenyltetrahydrofolate synthetase
MKNSLRKQIIKHRKSLSDERQHQINTEFLQKFIAFFDAYKKTYNPKIISGYISINNEINVLPALDYCRTLGLQTALPFCHGKNTDLTFHIFDGDIQTVSPDRFNIPAPNPATQIVIPDLILCPSVGVCRQTQQRLGYGGGFFDRYAHKNPKIHFIGGFCDFQIIDNPDIFAPYDLQIFNIIKI